MNKIIIKDIYNNILFQYECENNTIKITVETAIKNRISLCNANLCDANLRNANLCDANLYNAYLCNANLCDANLYNAYLCDANLCDIKINNIYRTDLNILKLQKNNIIVYKYLRKNMQSPYQNFKYEIGKKYTSKNADIDEFKLCGAGINVATLEWCLNDCKNDLDNNVIIECEVNPKDLIIPFNSDGKFRIKSGGKVKFNKKLTKEEIEEILNN